MIILFRYIFREIAASSLVGVLLFSFVLFLQRIGEVMALLVRADVAGSEVGRLVLLTLPIPLPYTIPVGILVGVLLGLGRLSTDSEIIAMRAAGVPGRSLMRPIVVFCLLAAGLCAWFTLDLSPWAARQFEASKQKLQISQATAQVPPRVFIERFPGAVVYVHDVEPGEEIRWKGLFMADTRAPESRGSVSGVNAEVDGPRITIAESAVVIPLPEQNRLQLHLPRASVFEQSFDATQYQAQVFELGDQVIETEPDRLSGSSKPFEQMSTPELWRTSREGDQKIDAGLMLHQRFALPLACLLLPLAGAPLAISTQRAGRSTGVILSLLMAFGYYMLLLGGAALADRGMLPPAAAAWGGNVVFALLAWRLLRQLDHPNRTDFLAWLTSRLRQAASRVRSLSDTGEIPRYRPFQGRASQAGREGRPRRRLGLGSVMEPFLSIADMYVLRNFLLYFGVMLSAFVSIWVIFSFFELLSDMLQRGKIALFPPYIYYLAPFLVYETAPLAILTATLICFGLLAKHQELIAFRACGVSLYRLAAPVLLFAIACSGALFVLDHYWLPQTNRRQDAIRDEIKGRPARTFLRADRQWTFGLSERIFYHRYFDWNAREMAPVFVYDFQQEPFELRRHLYAEKARWDEEAGAWVFENGWVRLLDNSRVVGFEQFGSRAFDDIEETPEYFRKEARQHQQMNWAELGDYISDLTQAGFETAELRVLWHRKLSFPMFAFAMALLALPFGLSTGSRGTLVPIAFSIAAAIAYFALSDFFVALGRSSQLTPSMAAWAPALLFMTLGGYLFLRVRS